MNQSQSGFLPKFSLKRTMLCALALPTVLALTPAAAKTLVYCSEGSPENFYPGVKYHGNFLRCQHPDLQPTGGL